MNVLTFKVQQQAAAGAGRISPASPCPESSHFAEDSSAVGTAKGLDDDRLEVATRRRRRISRGSDYRRK
jgi:hypothetical protein